MKCTFFQDRVFKMNRDIKFSSTLLIFVTVHGDHLKKMIEVKKEKLLFFKFNNVLYEGMNQLCLHLTHYLQTQ